MLELRNLEKEIIQIEETLFVLDNQLESVRIDNLHTERLIKVLFQNLEILKTPNIVISLESYRKTKLELKYLQERSVSNTKVENELNRKISKLEEVLVQKENLKTSMLGKISIDKVLIFKRF